MYFFMHLFILQLLLYIFLEYPEENVSAQSCLNYISNAGQWLIVISRIQNKRFCVHNMCVCVCLLCMYIYIYLYCIVYKYTHMHVYKKIYVYKLIIFICNNIKYMNISIYM